HACGRTEIRRHQAVAYRTHRMVVGRCRNWHAEIGIAGRPLASLKEALQGCHQMTTLVINNKTLANLAEAHDRRVWYLSREVARLDSLLFVQIACMERDRGKVSLDP